MTSRRLPPIKAVSRAIKPKVRITARRIAPKIASDLSPRKSFEEFKRDIPFRKDIIKRKVRRRRIKLPF